MPFKTSLAALACLLALGVGSASNVKSASADAEVDVSVFFQALEPHGEWVQVEPYGWSWVPEVADYDWRPYTVGHWTWVEPYGWMWVSDEPWSWATYHYGRWVYLDDYGWVWVPGTVWAPSWVVFRYGDPWVGWAPMPPGPNWRPDASYLESDPSVVAHAWTFAQTRWFAETDLSSHLVTSTYNPVLLQQTKPSTRFATVEGGIANRSIDIAAVEKARGAPIQKRRFQEAPALTKGPGVQVSGDSVVVYRPRIAAKPPAQAPATRARVRPGQGPDGNLDAWTAQRQAALKAYLEAQKKALETPGVLPGVVPADPKSAPKPEDDAKRREAALKHLQDEQKRMEALIERQRKRLERATPPGQQGPPPAPPGKPDDGPGKGKDKDKEKDHGKGGGGGKK